MSQVELVMEIDGGFSEGSDDVLVKSQSGSDNQWGELLQSWFESLQMSREEGRVD